MSYTIKIKFGKKMAKKLFAKKPELMSSLEEDAFAAKFIEAIFGAKPYKVTKSGPMVTPSATKEEIKMAVNSLFVPAEGKVEMQAEHLRGRVEKALFKHVDEVWLTEVLQELGFKHKIADNDLFYLLNYANHQASHTQNGNA